MNYLTQNRDFALLVLGGFIFTIVLVLTVRSLSSSSSKIEHQCKECQTQVLEVINPVLEGVNLEAVNLEAVNLEQSQRIRIGLALGLLILLAIAYYFAFFSKLWKFICDACTFMKDSIYAFLQFIGLKTKRK